MRYVSRWIASVLSWLVAMAGQIDLRAEEIDYLRDIKPLFATHCYACHGALKQEAGLRVDTAESMRQGGDSGAAVVSGAVDASLLLQRISSADATTRMPPEGKGLSADQIAKVTDWIRGGAMGPVDEQPQADPRLHWSFQPPRVHGLPDWERDRAGKSSIVGNAIDVWLNAKADELGVQSLGMATKRELIRRVTLDLIGLPPTREETLMFLADHSADAYERLVDRLLARPEYGERWGRHWMDVWRYSDWYGRRAVPDVMNSYPQIWRWRDWIVRSLNEDKGYDRMLMEMVAADELCPTDDANVVATGFIVRNWYKWNYETWMKDCVEHTGKAFLGLTLNCAHCHDHKFDPITQEDYFRFRAFFEPLELRHDRVRGEADPGPFKKYVYAESYGPIKSGAIRIFDEKLDAQTFMFSGGDARNRIEGKPPVDCGPPRAFTFDGFSIMPVDLPAESAYPGLKSFVREDEKLLIETEITQARSALAQAEANHEESKSKFAKLLADRGNPTASSVEDKPSSIAIGEASDLSSTESLTSGTLLRADQEISDTSAKVRVARAALDVAEAKFRSLQNRIAADDAAQNQSRDADEFAGLAHRSEKIVRYLAAVHAREVAELEVVIAERSLAEMALVKSGGDASAKADEFKKAVEAAVKKCEAVRQEVESARAQLATTGTSYTPLSPKYPSRSTGRRTALAKWLVDARNPLTARVAVNHIWMRHFGTPLVESTDNFGVQGKRPTHPELLDWLALKFVRDGWSMKSLHRLMVTSQAYQRSSFIGTMEHPSNVHDRDNVTYWRFPVRRMEAEVVRDSVLACSGALELVQGGPDIDVDQWIIKPRRSLYFTQHGEAQMQFLSTFDGANPCECYRRSSTVLPGQSLALTNSELVVHYSRRCAANLQQSLALQLNDKSAKRVVPDNVAFVGYAFEVLLGREPTEYELQTSLAFLEDSIAGGDQSTDSLTSNEIAGVQLPATDKAQRARENFIMALFNHNDFVTIR